MYGIRPIYWIVKNLLVIGSAIGLALVIDLATTFNYNPETKGFSMITNGNKINGATTTLINSNIIVYYVDKSDPDIINEVEISDTKGAN